MKKKASAKSSISKTPKRATTQSRVTGRIRDGRSKKNPLELPKMHTRGLVVGPIGTTLSVSPMGLRSILVKATIQWSPAAESLYGFPQAQFLNSSGGPIDSPFGLDSVGGVPGNQQYAKTVQSSSLPAKVTVTAKFMSTKAGTGNVT